jgi:hypothetical protein
VCVSLAGVDKPHSNEALSPGEAVLKQPLTPLFVPDECERKGKFFSGSFTLPSSLDETTLVIGFQGKRVEETQVSILATLGATSVAREWKRHKCID